MAQVDKRSHLVLFKQNQRNYNTYTSELQKACKTDYLVNRHNMMGTVSKLYVSNNTWIYVHVYIKKNLTKFQLQFQLQLPRVSTPIPTPTPGVSTPTPTPANLLNINSNSNSNSNSGGFNSNSNSNSGVGVGVEPNSNSNSGVDPNPDLSECWPRSVDLSSVRSSDILLRAISQQVSQPSITVIGLKSTHLKFH